MRYNLGYGIKLQRRKKNISQNGLGKMIGVSRSTISNWEIGRREVTLKEAVDLANFFRITLDELVDPKE